MATSRREPQPNARVNWSVRNTSPMLKPGKPDQGRRARSVPTSPDRRLSPSPASSSSNACRPSSSFNARTTSSRSTSGSASSSADGKTLHSASSITGAKQANTMRRKADKPGATSVWPPALATPNTSLKDITRAAKSPSTVQKSKLSTKPGTEKMATSCLKLRTQKAMLGALGAGKTQAVSSARAPGALSKRRMGAENSVSIQRTRSVPARQIAAPKIEEQEVELLMEFDEMESISTPSIDEHLQERLPDPVELKPIDVITYATSEDALSEPSSNQEEYKNKVTEHISEEKHEEKDNEDLKGGNNVEVGINSEVNVTKEAASKNELKEDVDETKLNKAVSETELNEPVDETELNEAVSETELKKAVDETKLKEAVNETELKDAVSEPELIVKEEAKFEEEMMLPTKTLELVQRWRKDDERSNEVTEEGRSKPMQERKNKVMALVGKFETVMSNGE
ncbi:uncharacterized protein LOC133918902 [Phragmites australis]|uniref:uncharacterized protein LOC133918902 n=1 Tax=Phragmites australis TaxID=29695 RepID=UPI002D7683C1|nr:uncharacterized protein LOC133918902 [Phragmites australis]